MPVFFALETETVRDLQAGRADANGQRPERAVSDGQGNPCRHCLQEIPAGQEMLVLAHRPFVGLHPYAEVGPIFLCADACNRAQPTDTLPEILTTSDNYLVKGYGENERLVYGTGLVVDRTEMAERIDQILEDPRVAFIHIRSARNNCYQVRAEAPRR